MVIIFKIKNFKPINTLLLHNKVVVKFVVNAVFVANIVANIVANV